MDASTWRMEKMQWCIITERRRRRGMYNIIRLICHMQLAALYNESYSKYSRSAPTPTRDARL